jgi:hypothetical protein
MTSCRVLRLSRSGKGSERWFAFDTLCTATGLGLFVFHHGKVQVVGVTMARNADNIALEISCSYKLYQQKLQEFSQIDPGELSDAGKGALTEWKKVLRPGTKHQSEVTVVGLVLCQL